MGHTCIPSKLHVHQFPTTSFRDFVRTDRQMPPKMIPARRMRAGNDRVTCTYVWTAYCYSKYQLCIKTACKCSLLLPVKWQRFLFWALWQRQTCSGQENTIKAVFTSTFSSVPLSHVALRRHEHVLSQINKNQQMTNQAAQLSLIVQWSSCAKVRVCEVKGLSPSCTLSCNNYGQAVYTHQAIQSITGQRSVMFCC